MRGRWTTRLKLRRKLLHSRKISVVVHAIHDAFHRRWRRRSFSLNRKCHAFIKEGQVQLFEGIKLERKKISAGGSDEFNGCAHVHSFFTSKYKYFPID